MSAQLIRSANTVSPPASASAPRLTLTGQRATRRIEFRPRYGGGGCAVQVSYLWQGASDAPTVIVQGGISAGRDVVAGADSDRPGWWQTLVGEGAAVDLQRYRVLCIDWLVPTDLVPVAVGDQAAVARPDAIATEDQAQALSELIHALGIGRVAAFVGASYGAMVGLAFAARHPDQLDKVVLLAGAHRAHPMATALRSVQRNIVRLGIASGHQDQALSLARQLAMTTYRGSEEFARRFDAPPEQRDGRFHFPVEDYLDAAGRRFVDRFDAERFLALSESIDLHQVQPESVTTPATLIGFPSDRVVPLADLCELQQRLRGSATLEVVESPYGHDGFLKETDRLAPLLRNALASS